MFHCLFLLASCLHLVLILSLLHIFLFGHFLLFLVVDNVLSVVVQQRMALWPRMDWSVQSGVLLEGLVIVHEQTAGLFVQRWLRERNDQKTLDYFQDVGKRPFSRVPIFLQRIDANFSSLWNIWMENFREEVTFGWLLREIVIQNKFASENPALKRSSNC